MNRYRGIDLAKDKGKKDSGKKSAGKDVPKPKEKPAGNRWLVVLGGLLIQLSLGSIYAYSTFSKAIGAQFLNDDGTALKPTLLVMPFVIGLVTFAIVMVIAGKLQDKIGPKYVAMMGGIILGVGTLASAYAKDIYTLTLTYGVIAGAGIGLGYVCPIAALVKWFPDKKGLISGVAVAAFGAGSFLIAQIAVAVMGSGMPAIDQSFLSKESVDLTHADGVAINTSSTFEDLDATKKATLIHHIETKNETGLKADKTFFKSVRTAVYAHFDLSKAFMVLGVMYIVMVVLGSLMLSNPPAGYKPPGWNPPVPAPGVSLKVDYTCSEMLVTWQYWLMWGLFIMGAISGLMIIGNVGFFASASSITAIQIAWIVGILALFNGAGRVVWGALGDKLGRPRVLFLMYLISGIVMLFLYDIVKGVDSPDQKFMNLAIGASAIGFCFGGNFAMYPSCTADYFGTKFYGLNYGAVFTAYGVAGAIGGFLAGYLTDPENPLTHGEYDAWQTVFRVMAVLCFVAMALTFLLKSPQAAAAKKAEKPKKKDEKVDEEE
jgi:OFA family oxalate/formate antiporter-like MFS transporter